jgi:hypothetical protein
VHYSQPRSQPAHWRLDIRLVNGWYQKDKFAMMCAAQHNGPVSSNSLKRIGFKPAKQRAFFSPAAIFRFDAIVVHRHRPERTDS